MDGALLIGLVLLVISVVLAFIGIICAAVHYVTGGTIMKYITLILATLLLFPAVLFSGLTDSEVQPLRIISAMAVPLGMFLSVLLHKRRKDKISGIQ